MASAYFRQFAIDNNLTVDYGYMFGRYKGFFISLKETMGTTKILTIMTTISENKEKLKEILSVFGEEELPAYQITNMVREKYYIQFCFDLPTAKYDMIVTFLDKFIESYTKDLKAEIICPLCGKEIGSEDKTAIIEGVDAILIAHESCYEENAKKESEEKEKIKEAKKKESTSKKVLDVAQKGRGTLGAFLYSLIYLAILVVSFFFMQFILSNAEDDDNFVLIFQYSPCLLSLCGAPLIAAGYDKFEPNGKTGRYIAVFWFTMITTFVGTFFGFVASLLLIADSDFITLVKLVVDLLKASSTSSFRWGFYVYIVVSLLLAALSFSIKMNSKSGDKGKFEKLE